MLRRFLDLDEPPGLIQQGEWTPEDEVTLSDWPLEPMPKPARAPINVQPRPPKSLITRRPGDKFATLKTKGNPYGLELTLDMKRCTEDTTYSALS